MRDNAFAAATVVFGRAAGWQVGPQNAEADSVCTAIRP